MWKLFSVVTLLAWCWSKFYGDLVDCSTWWKSVTQTRHGQWTGMPTTGSWMECPTDRGEPDLPSLPPRPLCHWLGLDTALTPGSSFSLWLHPLFIFSSHSLSRPLGYNAFSFPSTPVCSPRTGKLKSIHSFQCMSRLHAKVVDVRGSGSGVTAVSRCGCERGWGEGPRTSLSYCCFSSCLPFIKDISDSKAGGFHPNLWIHCPSFGYFHFGSITEVFSRLVIRSIFSFPSQLHCFSKCGPQVCYIRNHLLSLF